MPIFTKRIPMRAHAALQLGERLGGGRLEIDGSGGMIIDFYPRLGSERWPLRIRGVNLAWAPFELPIPGGKPIVVEGFRVNNPDFDLERCNGSYDPSTNDVVLHLEILLSPSRVSQLRLLGVDEVLRVIVEEKGKIDFERGAIIQTHARAFRIPSNLPEGLMEVRAGQNSCEATGHLFVAIAGSGASEDEIRRYQPTTAMICPRSQVIFGWQIDGLAQAKSATITGGASPIPVDLSQSTGSSAPVSVQQDTTFTLEVTDKSDCKNTSSVDVTVVKAGTLMTIQANKQANAVWGLTLPAMSYDQNIKVTSIHSDLCFSQDSAYADWALYKQDVDGSVHVVNVGAIDLPLNPFPLPGTWQFSPVGTGTLITAPGYDPDYDRIPPSEENMACFTAHLTC